MYVNGYKPGRELIFEIEVDSLDEAWNYADQYCASHEITNTNKYELSILIDSFEDLNKMPEIVQSMARSDINERGLTDSDMTSGNFEVCIRMTFSKLPIIFEVSSSTKGFCRIHDLMKDENTSLNLKERDICYSNYDNAYFIVSASLDEWSLGVALYNPVSVTSELTSIADIRKVSKHEIEECHLDLLYKSLEVKNDKELFELIDEMCKYSCFRAY